MTVMTITWRQLQSGRCYSQKLAKPAFEYPIPASKHCRPTPNGITSKDVARTCTMKCPTSTKLTTSGKKTFENIGP